MSTPFVLQKDVNGSVTFGFPFVVSHQNVTLTPNVAQSITVPAATDTILVTYSGGANVWVNGNGTAVLPTGTFSDTGCELNPVVRSVSVGQTISFISNAADQINVNFLLLYNMGYGVQP